MSEILELEIQTYEKNRNKLIASSEGKYVLIHKDEILGVFETQNDAIIQGYNELGNIPFLVKQILTIESTLDFVSNLLGV